MIVSSAAWFVLLWSFRFIGARYTVHELPYRKTATKDGQLKLKELTRGGTDAAQSAYGNRVISRILS